MKFKLDENLPESLVARLQSLGHDVDTVMSEGIAGHDDDAVWSHAEQDKRFLITQDLDFSDTRRFLPGTHPGSRLVRLKDPGGLALTACVSDFFASRTDKDLTGCFIVLTRNKVRIRRPPEA